MEWLIIIGLGVAVYAMFERIKRLEKRVDDAEWRSQFAAPQAAPAPIVSSSLSAGPAVSVPAAARQIDPLAKPMDAPEAERISAPLSKAEPETETPASAATAQESQPEPEPEAESEPLAASPTSYFSPRKFDFEDIFGRRLPIWAGGIALAVAGVYLVMYSIENGLMTPPVRVGLSFAFGIALLAVAELAHRFEKWVADPRVRQALAGAGLATLYAAFYLAGAMYGLIGPTSAFAGLAGVTALAIGLTFRFGLPAAVLGLVGGFATPLMVASESANVPILTFYLALTTAGLALTGRRIGQPWLGMAALVAGFGWGAVLLATDLAGNFDITSLGLYLVALGVGVPLLAAGSGEWSLPRIGAGAVAVLELAYLVDLAGYDALTWGLFLLLAAGLAALAWREEALRPGDMLVAALGAVLLTIWPEPDGLRYTLTATAFAAIAIGVPLALLWRGRASVADLMQLSLTAPAIAAAASVQFGIADNEVFQPQLAAGFALLGILPAIAAWRLWKPGDLAKWLPLPVGVAALLGLAALHLLLPDWAEVIGAVLVALVLCALVWKRKGVGLEPLAWVAAAIGLVALLSANPVLEELSRLIGDPYGDVDLAQALIRWAVAGLPFAALAWLHERTAAGRIAEALFAFTLYGLVAQVIPADWLAWSAAILAMACVWWQRSRAGFWGAMAVFAGLWGMVVFGQWAAQGLEALAGMPMLAADLPGWRVTLRELLPVASALGLGAWLLGGKSRRAAALAVAASGLVLVVLHLLFKQIFPMLDYEDFVARGMAERTIWQALLLGAGISLSRLRLGAMVQYAGTALAVLALAHFAWFTLVLHNPLWAAQSVGPWPVANWLLPAYGLISVAAVWLASRGSESLLLRFKLLADAAVMGLIGLFALSTLRHAFSGSLLSAMPMSQNEDLLRSLLGIVLALGFLWWGSRRDERSWRIGSLVLMLAAVLKVFLVDAAGLAGLLRIASFLALGFSLIGIGWVYSRQLASRSKPSALDAPPAAEPAPPAR